MGLSPIVFADSSQALLASSQYGVLQIDHSEYDVSYTNSTIVKVNGTINHPIPGDAKVAIVFKLPDGTTSGSEIGISENGYFEMKLPLNSNSQKGSYVVFVSYSNTIVGQFSFIVKQVPVFRTLLNTTSVYNTINSKSNPQTSLNTTLSHTDLKSVISTHQGPIITINDNVTGGDCNFFGSWIPAYKTCFLRENIYKKVVIDSNGITLDGNQNTLKNLGDVNDQNGILTIGITLNGKTGILIENLFVENFGYGISLSNSNFNTISNNTIYSSGHGAINLQDSNGNKITGNNIVGYTRSGNTNPHNTSGILLSEGSSQNILLGNTIRQNYVGIMFNNGSYNTISKNIVNSNRVGISFENSIKNSLSDNTISGNLDLDIKGNNPQNINTVPSHDLQSNKSATSPTPVQTTPDVSSQQTVPTPSETSSADYWPLSGFLLVLGIVAFFIIRQNVKKIKQQKELEELGSFSVSRLDSMDGYDFEFFLKKLFELDGYKVEHTKLSGDFGADLIISKKGERIAIQAKRHNANVNLKAVQEVGMSLKVYHATKGMVITNSYYTDSAVKLAKLHNVDLIDRSDLQEMINDIYRRNAKSKKPDLETN